MMRSGRDKKRIDTCDVVVVGAGLVGATVAARLARRGLDTAVLDAQHIAGGATGRSAGMVLTGLPGHYSGAIETYGRREAQEIWELTIKGRVELVRTANRLNVPVHHTGSLVLAVSDTEAEALRESAELLQEDGFNGRLRVQDPLNRGFQAALRYPDDVMVDATSLTRALVSTTGVTVHEMSEVYDLEPEGDRVRVWAQGRSVLCSAVVLAVNGYAPLIDAYFADKVAPTRSLVLATDSLDTEVLEMPCSADYGHAYCCQSFDRRVLLGGWHSSRAVGGTDSSEAELDDVVCIGLMRFAERYFPDIETSEADRWSGVMGCTPDGLPLLGVLPNLPRAYFAVGFGGRGLAWAFVAADRVVGLIERDTDPGILSANRLA